MIKTWWLLYNKCWHWPLKHINVINDISFNLGYNSNNDIYIVGNYLAMMMMINNQSNQQPYQTAIKIKE